MRIPFSKISAFVLLAAMACAGGPTATALAETGGVSSAPVTAIKKVALATWFGPGFYGQTTACGQTLSPAMIGVANRTLPCGTLVKFGYKGRAATVPVIDRGPYAHNGAQWDLTTEAARVLGMADTARLHTRIVGSVPNTPTLGLPPAAAAPPAALVTTGGAPAA